MSEIIERKQYWKFLITYKDNLASLLLALKINANEERQNCILKYENTLNNKPTLCNLVKERKYYLLD